MQYAVFTYDVMLGSRPTRSYPLPVIVSFLFLLLRRTQAAVWADKEDAVRCLVGWAALAGLVMGEGGR